MGEVERGKRRTVEYGEFEKTSETKNGYDFTGGGSKR